MTNKIQCLFIEIDGVLTNGNIICSSNNILHKTLYFRDLIAIKEFVRHGYKLYLFADNNNAVNRSIANELSVEVLYYDTDDKLEIYEKIKNNFNLADENCAYIGSDTRDLTILTRVGLSSAPIDALYEIKDSVDHVIKKNSGSGAVRDFIIYILAWNEDYKKSDFF